ncbi:MAG: chemotaxis protein CheA [Ignavibacteria bacterium]|nr:chemotaxis protein CheA [Ignavibacteria bacterium]
MDNQERKYFNEFAEDAFLEIDENLQKIKSEIIKLEKFVNKTNIDKKILNNLLIPFHTIKGISGMVGMPQIQNISHSVEHYIKCLIEKGLLLKSEGIDFIYKSIKILETLLVLYKENKLEQIENLQKEIDNLINELMKLCDESPISEKKDEKTFIQISSELSELIKNYLNTNKFIYSLKFFPSPELFAKGININKVREILSQECEIIKSSPLKDEKGAVYFELIVASEKELEENEFLNEAKINFTRYYSPEPKSIKQETTPSSSISDYQKFSVSNVVKIELNKIDELINMLGDLVIMRSKLSLSLRNFVNKLDKDVYRTLSEINSNLERKIRDLRDGIMRTRLVPIGELFERMRFVIHDLVRQSQKSIELELSGGDTEIDKFVVEKMFDPLLHLVRNSVSHGIESSEERKKIGKSPTGKISISAKAAGNSVVIEISDDGRGIDKKKVVEKAFQLGLVKSNKEISETELLNIICSPGFSTKNEADLASGRGVGMTSVKQVVDELGGRIELLTETGKGTKFIISLPLTLAIVDAIIIEVGGQLFAIPQPSISEVVDVEKSKIKISEGFHFIEYRDEILPIIFLREYFNINSFGKNSNRFVVIVIETNFGKVGLAADRIRTKQEIVVRALNDPLIKVDAIFGATELGDGKAVLIIDGFGLVNSFLAKTKKFHEVSK